MSIAPTHGSVPRSEGRRLDAARRWGTAFRAILRKELRDLAWLACGVAMASAMFVVGAGALFDFVIAAFTPATWPTWCALGALAALPLAAEVLCADGRTGTARRAQAWPTPRAAVIAAKLVALISYATLLLAVLLVASALAPGVRTMVPLDAVRDVLPPIAPVALAMTLVTAAVTGHSLAALLAGLATGAVLAALQGASFMPQTLASARLELWVMELLSRSTSPVALGIAALCVAWIHARRGPAARSVPRRALRASACMGVLAIAQFALESPRWFVTPRLAFDDPGAEVFHVHPSPDGRKIAVELFHRPSFCTTWWLIDAIGEAPPRRVSTPEVTRATGLGTAWQAGLLDWSIDGSVLVGASTRGRNDSFQSRSWTIDPVTLSVDHPPGHPALLGGSWIERKRTPDSTADAPREVWSLPDGSAAMTLPVSRMLDRARRAPGVAFYTDADRSLHRVDLVAGEDLSTDVVLDESEGHPQFSDDGRWVVRKRASGLELVELTSGRSRAVPGTEVLHQTSRVRNRSGWGRWTKRPEPLVIDVSDGDDYSPKRWRLVGLDSEREFSVPYGHTPPVDLDGTHWLVCCVIHRRIELLDADGTILRTLRAPREGVQ